MDISEIGLCEAPIEAVIIVQNALSDGLSQSLLLAAQKNYQDIAAMLATEVDSAKNTFSTEKKYLPHASSFSLEFLDKQSLINSLLGEIGRSTAGRCIRRMLGVNEVVCDLDQAWMRRQYAPHLYPPIHAPHGWHQDGALGFDFLTHVSLDQGASALLPTITCWITLTPSGVEAPGLEFVSQKIEQLLFPEELTSKHINQHFSEELFCRPSMQIGDAAIFYGGTLHRTHVLKDMQLNRTSVELRFVAKNNIPQRLLGDKFIPLPNGPT